MIVQDVLNEVKAAAGSHPDFGGRSYEWNASKISPPAFIVDLPNDGDYDQTYGRGSDQLNLEFTVVAGAVDRPSAKRLMGYVSGSGPTSVKVLLEAHAWTACDDLTVTRFEVVVATFGTVQYLAAQFAAVAMGKGGS